jgi:arylsulfatase A-like enzyme
MLMISQNDAFMKSGTVERPARDATVNALGPLHFVILSAWCGLLSGLLEVGIRSARKQTVDLNHFYRMSRDFVWIVPLTNLVIFIFLGALLWLLAMTVGRRGRSLASWLLGGLTLLPPFLVAFPGIYGLAGLLLVLGAAARLVPAVERRAVGFRRLVRISLPILAGLVAVLAASLWCGDRIEQWRESARPMPPPGSPNVLLIVLDTVAADHLSLHGYSRRTTPAIDELAEHGVRFDNARATASWTLASHASMFTGKWPHELSAGWNTPLDRTDSILAEFLVKRGYATAGFVANFDYCARDSGLARGFTVYHDYIFPGLTALRMATLVERPVNGLAAWHFLDELNYEPLTRNLQRLWCLFTSGRKHAEVVNREFLHWLSPRRLSERPFFAFLNFIDAHHPYRLRRTGVHRFCTELRNRRDNEQVNCLELTTSGSAEDQIGLARDCYDDCLADLDEQVGKLTDELERRAVLDRTWVIITSDHGESFGEHAGVIRHGSSLYQTELHVPLVIIPPGGRSPGPVVTDVVSTRDLAATIVDVVGFQNGSPFPGKSLARFWNPPAQPAPSEPAAEEWALSEIVPHDPVNPPPPERVNSQWPLAALRAGDWTYIRREGELQEELYQARDDADERHNLAADPAMRTTLQRMKEAMGRLTAGPLLPQRFNP